MNVRLFFLLASFFGQGLSSGKIYISHIAAVLFALKNISNLKQAILPLNFLVVFLAWSALTLVWSHDVSSIKYFMILGFGVLQYFFWSTVKGDEEKTIFLKGLFTCVLLEFLVGMIESFGIWRFPISSLNPEVIDFGKNFVLPTALNDFQKIYHTTSPTGFRWGPNNFIISILFFLVFIHRYLKEKWFWIFYSLVSYLTIAASSRVIFWAIPGVFALFFIVQRSYRKVAPAVIVPLCICFSLTFLMNSIGHKARECKDFPIRIFKNVTNFEQKILTPSKIDAPARVEADQVSSESTRFKYYKNALKVWKSSPVIGAGLGKSSIDPDTGKAQSPHFYLLEVMADTGIVGLFLYLAALLFPLLKLRGKSSEHKAFHLVIFMIVILGSIVMSSIVYFPIYYLALGFSHWELQRST